VEMELHPQLVVMLLLPEEMPQLADKLLVLPQVELLVLLEQMRLPVDLLLVQPLIPLEPQALPHLLLELVPLQAELELQVLLLVMPELPLLHYLLHHLPQHL